MKKFHQDFRAAVANPPSVPGHKCRAPEKYIKYKCRAPCRRLIVFSMFKWDRPCSGGSGCQDSASQVPPRVRGGTQSPGFNC